MELLLYLRALHIIFIVAWFSGLFFLGRIFIYSYEALLKPESEKELLLSYFLPAQRRVLYIIVLPSIFITLCVGSFLMIETQAYLYSWFHVKLLLLLLFLLYNFYCIRIHYALHERRLVLSSFKLRLLNEVPFVFLILICFTVFLKSVFHGFFLASIFSLLIVSVGLFFRFLNRKK